MCVKKKHCNMQCISKGTDSSHINAPYNFFKCPAVMHLYIKFTRPPTFNTIYSFNTFFFIYISEYKIIDMVH